MRQTSRVIRAVAIASAFALTIAPAARAADVVAPRADGRATCPPITRTGTYRIEIQREGKEPKFALLVLERASGCLSALLVTEGGPSPLDITEATSETLTARSGSGRGKAVMSLRFTDTGVTGDVVIRKQSYAVAGIKTS
jgi:hypothetical protein